MFVGFENVPEAARASRSRPTETIVALNSPSRRAGLQALLLCASCSPGARSCRTHGVIGCISSDRTVSCSGDFGDRHVLRSAVLLCANSEQTQQRNKLLCYSGRASGRSTHLADVTRRRMNREIVLRCGSCCLLQAVGRPCIFPVGAPFFV